MDHAPRTTVWDRRLLLTSGSAAAAATVWFVVTFVAGPVGPTLLGWLVAPVSTALAAVAAWRVGRVAGVPAPARRFWRLLGGAFGVLALSLVSQIADAVNADLSMTMRVGGLTSLLHAAATVLVVVPMLRLPWGMPTRGRLIAAVIDVAILVVGAGIFFWHFAAQLLFENAAHASVAAGLMLTGSGLLALTAIAKMAVTAAGTLDGRSLRALRAAFVVGPVGAALAPLLVDKPYLDPSLLIMPIGSALAILAAQRQAVAGAAATPERERSRRWSPLAYGMTGATNALLIVILVRNDQGVLPVAVTAVVLTSLVISRQIASMRENEQLVEQLDANMLTLRRKEQRFRSLVQNSSDVVTITRDGVIDYISPAVERVLGHSPESMVGSNIMLRVHPEDEAIMRENVQRVTAGPGTTATYQVRIAHQDGSYRMMEITSANMLDEPSVRGIVSNSRDVTETVEAHQRLSYEASHDVLTGLANRALFSERVEAAVRRAGPEQSISIVLVDLDDFKIVNDTLGHAVGDDLLVTVAERMQESVRPTDTVARLGGDEFAIIFEGLRGGDVDRVLDRIADALAVPADIGGHLLSARASFGVVDGRGGDDPGNLLRQADIAMYEAKERGVGGFQRYRPGSEARGVERHRITAALTAALERQEFLLHYQPVVSLPDGTMTGVEALVRWMHPKRGLLGPAEFIPGAELTGMIMPLGRWVLGEACRQAAEWIAELGAQAPGTMAVNVSARQLQAPGFADEVADALRTAGLPAHRLTIEITESTAISGEGTHDTLRVLRAMGVRLALDDFGTGASTLSLLAHCPVDQIKLDRSFAPVPGPDAVAGAVLQIARAMGVEAVAEGVETPEQATKLGDLGYVRAQGFHFARPMAAELIAVAIREPAEFLGVPQ
ncbi:bifunctional diguanylate cyclase/phosphodiesterase [Actinoplanes sp. N902-109]|uniref:putative bifunctional diguanylate cyclase/phosphodiesterase n=1 Tax=Actinoplanes sp. (strain N902-109) TaxID=649831 RepID=UPI0003294A6B|nr:EAL domain-containing protein [Actinoplanes sp. N902-109]AGL14065.1 PAS/PAC sensor-containing diguanylate cyclase/phosphodiesterase [Actinoplanes sp. N902-109]